MPDNKKTNFWRNLVDRVTKGPPVRVGKYSFSRMASDTFLPEEPELRKMANAIEAVNATLGPNKSFENRIILDPRYSAFHIYFERTRDNTIGYLRAGPANFTSEVAESSLTAILHHEAEHLNQDSLTLEIARFLTRFTPESSEFIVACRQNRSEVVRDLINTYRPKKLLTKLDNYIAGLERCQEDLEVNLKACENSPFIKSLMEYNSPNSELRAISANAVSAIIYDMEGDQKLYRECNENFAENFFFKNYDPFAEFSRNRNAKDRKPARPRKVNQQIIEKFENKLQRIAELDEKINELAIPLWKLGSCIQWAEEFRCDRVSAQRNTKRSNGLPEGIENAGEIEHPFGLVEYLQQINCMQSDLPSHPSYNRRAEKIAETAITRYAEELMLSGAPEQDARQIAEARVRQEADACNAPLPSALHPVSSSETSAARRDYCSHVERLSATRQRTKQQER